jgi:hypothetical protein
MNELNRQLRPDRRIHARHFNLGQLAQCEPPSQPFLQVKHFETAVDMKVWQAQLG